MAPAAPVVVGRSLPLVAVLLVAGAIGALGGAPRHRPRLKRRRSPPSRHRSPAGVPVPDDHGPVPAEHKRDDRGPGGLRAQHPSPSASPPGAGTVPGTVTRHGRRAQGRGRPSPAKIEQTGTLGLTVGRGDLRHRPAQLTGAGRRATAASWRPRRPSRVRAGSPANGTRDPAGPGGRLRNAAQGSARSGHDPRSLSTKATDVTSQYVDLQSRVVALQASRQQYLTIMAKATTGG